MKRAKLIALLSAICMAAAPVFAETGLKIGGSDINADAIALNDLGISVEADHYTTVRQDDDGFVYIYTIEDDSIPYVIIGQYNYTSDDFTDDFTEYMNEQYEDLKETSRDSVTIDGLDFDRVTYEYTVSGYDVNDTRLFHAMNDSTYMFGAKEVPELDYVVDYDFLEDVAGSMKPLKDSEYSTYVDSDHDITQKKEAEKKPKAGGMDDIKTGVSKEDPKQGDRIRFSESMASWQGTWIPFEDGFKLYLPNTWNEFILTDEQKESGVLYQAGDARAVDGENAPYISVNYGPAPGIETMEDVREDMKKSGYYIEGIVNVNGIECLSYSYDDPNLSGMMFFCPGSTDYVFAVVAYNYDDYEDILAPALCSISLK